jgi:NAD(P)-dependent dehydrogenase (short-subunit alcohol dehydrogenase family)
MQMGLVEGKIALVTGAARGQGRSYAARLTRECANVTVVDICADVEAVPYAVAMRNDLEQTVDLIRKTGRQGVVHEADVYEIEQVRDAVDRGVTELMTNLLPVERLQPGDVSQTVLFLVSEMQQCITGVT